MTTCFEKSFWEKVAKIGPDECWLWKACVDKDGYGQVGKKISGKYMTRQAHREAWELSKGQIPIGIQVLHKCDVPPCVNPNHLFLGTHKDNMIDRSEKGRNNLPFGEGHANSKLNDKKVREIRRHYHLGKVTYEELGLLFDISPAIIGNVVRRETWKHVT